MFDTEASTPRPPLHALVCGFEKSGTTLLNEILRRHPALDSGFECGMLLGNSPRDFPGIQPYFTFFRDKWRVSREDMDWICDTDDWSSCYARIRERSPVIEDKSVSLFDKTPIYMKHLPEVLARMPDIPCVVNVRDPRALMLSWARWSGHRDREEQFLAETFDKQVERYLSYGRGYRTAAESSAGRLYLNRFETLCTAPVKSLESLFAFHGLVFEEEYLHFSSEHFVYGTTVSTDYLLPYQGVLSAGLCDRILNATREFEDWHYHP